METVLQSAHFVETRAGSYLPVEVTLGNIFRLQGQCHYRRHSLMNDEIAEGQHDQQTEKDDADDGIDHVVVVLENILLRTDEGQSPTGIRQRLLHDKTVGALQIVHRGTFLASSNDGIFGTHENEVGVGISPFAVENLREHALREIDGYHANGTTIGSNQRFAVTGNDVARIETGRAIVLKGVHPAGLTLFERLAIPVHLEVIIIVVTLVF